MIHHDCNHYNTIRPTVQPYPTKSTIYWFPLAAAKLTVGFPLP